MDKDIIQLGDVMMMVKLHNIYAIIRLEIIVNIFLPDWIHSILLLSINQENMNFEAKMGFCPFHPKDATKCPYFKTIFENTLVLKLNFLKIEFYIETRFLENWVIGNQTLKKKKKIYVTRVPCEFFQITRFSSNRFLHWNLISKNRVSK